MNPFVIHCGDALAVLKTLEAGSAQCCVTSPPYYGLRDYGVDGQIGLEQSPDQYIDRLVEVFAEVHRVLRADGTLWVNIGDSYAANRPYQVSQTKDKGTKRDSNTFNHMPMRVPDGLKSKDLIGIPWMLAFALRKFGWYLRQDIIWAKPNPMPESVKDRCTKSHEYIFLLSKSQKYFYDADTIREPTVDQHVSWQSRKSKGEPMRRGMTVFNEEYKSPHLGSNPLGRNKRSVWTITTKPFRGAHFAVMPEDLVEPCVLAGSRKNDTVLDPFAGAGTTGIVANRHGRNFIGIELNSDYIVIVDERRKSTERASLIALFESD
jgi:DNA modification methylase